MPAGSRRVVQAAAVVLLIALAAPAAAFADGGGSCNASACKVYHEGGAPNGGHHQTTTPTTTPTTPTGSTGNDGGNQPRVSNNKSRVLQEAGKDKGPLKNLLAGDSSIGSLPSGSGGGSPGLLGAAFDLGVGPTVLLVILLATALGLATRGSLPRRLRRRSRS